MFSKSNLIATLVAGIFMFLGGYLIWGTLMVDFFSLFTKVFSLRGSLAFAAFNMTLSFDKLPLGVGTAAIALIKLSTGFGALLLRGG